MLVMLALATHVTSARADAPKLVAAATNTITQTAITSPSDPSYFYDPTAGAYGGITVTGTTNSTDPSSDTVDIECYDDNGSSAESYYPGAYDIYQLVTGVPLDSNGDFSTTIPYSAIEQDGGMCRLRAVPTSATPPSDGLGSFAGPRVMLAYLEPQYSSGDGSYQYGWQVVAPQLGAVDNYWAASNPYGCGLGMSLESTSYFGVTADPSFDCSDPFENGEAQVGGLTIDTSQYGPQQAYDSWDTSDPVTVQVTQDPSSGDVTIIEDELLQVCPSSCVESGIEDQRTIQQAADGKVVMISDKFVNSGSEDAQVTFSASSEFDMGAFSGGNELFELPGQSSYSTYSDGDTVDLGSGSTGTVYSYNDAYSDGTDAGYDALSYFATPSADATFSQTWAGYGGPVSVLTIPFTVDVPAGGSGSIKLAYASEYSQAALSGDLQTELDLQTAPTVTISSPAAGSTVSTSSATVTGSVAAATGVQSVTVNGQSATVSGSTFSATVPLSSGTNTITAVATTNSGIKASDTESVTYTPPSSTTTPPTTTTTTTTTTTAPITPASTGKWAGPVWLPIADTGTARHAGVRKEKLSGQVTAGSGSVTYHFEYGTHGNLAHHTASVELAASDSSQHVAFTIGGLSRGAKYRYRLVATGSYGHSVGRSRSFKTAAHKK